MITDHRVTDHTDTGRGGEAREARQGSNDIPSDHTVITDDRDTDHTVTGGGEVRKARQGSNDNQEELGEHPASSPQLSPASA